MAIQEGTKLSQLGHLLPEGLIVDAAWLTRHGYSPSLRGQYVSSGWLVQPTRQVYRRPRGSLTWEQVVVSLQTLLDAKLVVGGRTALELQGNAHYLSQGTREVHLYGPRKPPAWVHNLPLSAKFVYHNSARLILPAGVRDSPSGSEKDRPNDLADQSWGPWGWKLKMSSPERALLELLDELPDHETFDQVDKLTEGLTNLSPRRLQNLLERCRSVKVKRLFFFFADRHDHAWLPRINKKLIGLGKGKRSLVRGGTFNAAYQITIPKDFNGLQ